MNIETKSLVPAVNQVSKLAAGRATLPILNHLRLSASGGILEIAGTNLDAYQIGKVECDGDLEPTCIPANHFQRLTANGNGSISLELVKSKLLIKSGWSAELPTLSAAEFPPFPEKDLKPIAVNCADLADGIEGTAWACHQDAMVEFVLSCISIELSAKSIQCIAADRRLCSYFNRASIAGVLCVSAPGKAHAVERHA